LWHGAAWHFVVWGALHASFQIAERSLAQTAARKPPRAHGVARKAAGICGTFALVCFAWIFFRADTIRDALLVIAKLTALPAELAGYVRALSQVGVVGTVREAFQLEGAIAVFGLKKFGISLLYIAFLLMSERVSRTKADIAAWIARKPAVLRWAGYYAMTLMILLNWNTGSAQFIYFTF
jgi:hypothetical protein